MKGEGWLERIGTRNSENFGGMHAACHSNVYAKFSRPGNADRFVK